ncbi:MAG: integrase, partial [Pseudomonadota bacterium]
LMKAFRTRQLMESDEHRIYSLRHAFEKRMQEAGIDYGLRCILMGHKNTRPSYGDGGSLEYRRGELEKIVHPVTPKLKRAVSELQ